ncbi:uncharacterized protein LOC143039804 [Oratosquilla oratoria]|uniref:uncharacterized protein LOC143039804 n=1 Tax=Oratosquilla oratoria TaxID=337810 RepID=UPI003F76F894
MHLNDGQSRQFAQLYVIDSEQATDIRTGNPTNVISISEILQNLDSIIREHNVFAAAFKTLREVELYEAEQAQREQRPEYIISLFFNRDRNADRRRYNLPTVNDIATIFQNPDGEPPFHRDFKVYPRNEDAPLINLNILSPNLDPMAYTLFFPFDEPGWQPKMEGNARQGINLRRRNVTMLQQKIS